MTTPAEHCGHQPDHVIGQPTECVLRPGHSGSHADETGMRWWLAKLPDETTTDRPGVDQLTSDMLDQLYDERDQLRAELTALKSITSGYCFECGRGDCSPTADQWYEQRVRADRHEATLTAVRDELAAIDRDVRGKSVVALAGIRHTSSRIRAVLDQHGQTTT